MRFNRGFKIGEWMAFVVLTLLVAGFVHSCSRHGVGG